jgi:hypothetical protein
MVQKIKATNGASNPQIDSAVVGIQTRTPLSNMALLTLLGRMDCGDTTCAPAIAQQRSTRNIHLRGAPPAVWCLSTRSVPARVEVPQTVRRNETVSLAARVLSRGAASIAPRGRADDFSWPRPNATTAEELEPRPNIGCPVVPLEEGIKTSWIPRQ